MNDKKSEDVISAYSDNIPDTWGCATLPELTAHGVFSDGDWVESKDQDENGEVRLIQLADIGANNFKDKSDKHLTLEKAKELDCTFLQEGDVLIARMPDPLGRATIFPGKDYPCVTVVDVCIARSGGLINQRWLTHFSNSPSVRRIVEDLQSGTTRKRISRKNIAKIEIPVPPRKEQERIVAKIEELFSKLDAGNKAVELAKGRLNQYRRALLTSAMEGKLTVEWRENNPAEGLRNDLIANEIASREKLQNRVAELDIPPNWEIVKLEEIGKWHGGKTPRRSREDYWGGEINWVSPKEMKTDRIDDTQDKMTEKALEENNCYLAPKNSLLFVTRSGILEHSLPVAINTREVTVNQDLKSFEPEDFVHSDFLLYAIQAYEMDILRECSKDGTTVASLDSSKLYSYTIALPPLEEQRQIVSRVQRQLSVLEDCLNNIEQNLRYADRLKSAVLEEAFHGNLVPQNPEDGLADEMLTRLRGDEGKDEEAGQTTLQEVINDVN